MKRGGVQFHFHFKYTRLFPQHNPRVYVHISWNFPLNFRRKGVVTDTSLTCNAYTTVDLKTHRRLKCLPGFWIIVEHKPFAVFFPSDFVDETAHSVSQIRNAVRQNILRLILHSLQLPPPNLAHFLLGYELRKPVAKTNLQDPGK